MFDFLVSCKDVVLLIGDEVIYPFAIIVIMSMQIILYSLIGGGGID